MPLAYLLSIARKIHIFIKIKIIFFFVFQSYPFVCVHSSLNIEIRKNEKKKNVNTLYIFYSWIIF